VKIFLSHCSRDKPLVNDFKEFCGYDLHAMRGGQELHIEVKGVSGDKPRFFISRTELKAATQDADWRLAVVVGARSRPRMNSYILGNRIKRLFHMEPTQWFATTRGFTKR
jgi:Protein NO VEIN, C-terminal